MDRLMTILRIGCLVAGVAGMAISAWAFIDPSAFPAMAESQGMLGPPPSPRWRAALGFLMSLLVAGYGAGVLRHRQLP